jgi:hypothetical protein
LVRRSDVTENIDLWLLDSIGCSYRKKFCKCSASFSLRSDVSEKELVMSSKKKSHISDVSYSEIL